MLRKSEIQCFLNIMLKIIKNKKWYISANWFRYSKYFQNDFLRNLRSFRRSVSVRLKHFFLIFRKIKLNKNVFFCSIAKSWCCTVRNISAAYCGYCNPTYWHLLEGDALAAVLPTFFQHFFFVRSVSLKSIMKIVITLYALLSSSSSSLTSASAAFQHLHHYQQQ